MPRKGRANYPTDSTGEQWEIERFDELLKDGLAAPGSDSCLAGIASVSSMTARRMRSVPRRSSRWESRPVYCQEQKPRAHRRHNPPAARAKRTKQAISSKNATTSSRVPSIAEKDRTVSIHAAVNDLAEVPGRKLAIDAQGQLTGRVRRRRH